MSIAWYYGQPAITSGAMINAKKNMPTFANLKSSRHAAHTELDEDGTKNKIYEPRHVISNNVAFLQV